MTSNLPKTLDQPRHMTHTARSAIEQSMLRSVKVVARKTKAATGIARLFRISKHPDPTHHQTQIEKTTQMRVDTTPIDRTSNQKVHKARKA